MNRAAETKLLVDLPLRPTRRPPIPGQVKPPRQCLVPRASSGTSPTCHGWNPPTGSGGGGEPDGALHDGGPWRLTEQVTPVFRVCSSCRGALRCEGRPEKGGQLPAIPPASIP